MEITFNNGNYDCLDQKVLEYAPKNVAQKWEAIKIKRGGGWKKDLLEISLTNTSY